jgi:uncharacterized protein YegL
MLWYLLLSLNITECDGYKMDVMMVIDSSSSIKTANFAFVQQLALQMVNIADLESGNVRMGAVQFSTDANMLFGFNEHLADGVQDKSTLLSMMDNMEYIRGSTSTGQALELATKELRDNRREDANPFIFLFTDGKPSDTDTETKAKMAHALGYRVFVMALGIEEQEERDLINEIASEPAKLNVLYLTNFTQIEEYYKSVYQLFCRGMYYNMKFFNKIVKVKHQ